MPVHAATVRSQAAEAELVAASAAIVPGSTLTLGLRLKLDPGWHVYWKNAGDSGAPPSVQLQLPDGYAAGDLQFPYPQRIPIAHLVNYGYEDEVLFPLRVEVPANAVPGSTVSVRAQADWLECKESCLPATAALELTLPVAQRAEPGRWAPLFAETGKRLPRPLPAGATASSTAGNANVSLNVSGLDDCREADFFPDREGVFVHARIQRVEHAGQGLRFLLPAEANASLPQVLSGIVTCAAATPAGVAYGIAAPLAAATQSASPAASAAPLTLSVALLFAFLGGLALNLMPCVFPVLGLKILGLAHRAHFDRQARVGHAAGFLAGVVLSFGVLAAAMLALRAAGEQIGWGFQLQSPVFVSAIALLFFVLALNLSGYFEWGSSLQSLAARIGGNKGGAFLDGGLAVLIASPCTAPLMGAAIGYTLAQPDYVVFGVFAAMAVGMAVPYVVLAIYPAWARRLPRPGPWLESVRQFFAFPLYATVLWLIWVLGELAGLSAAIRLGALLLAVTLGLWLLKRRSARVFFGVLAASILLAAVAWLQFSLQTEPANATPASAQAQWQPWAPATFDQLRRQGKPILIDFTAAWCVTCQVNKYAVLNTDTVAQALRETGTVALRADWTRRDAEITRALAALDRNGVPVYALYDAQGKVTVLPEILTTRIVVEALQAVREDGAQQRAAVR